MKPKGRNALTIAAVLAAAIVYFAWPAKPREPLPPVLQDLPTDAEFAGADTATSNDGVYDEPAMIMSPHPARVALQQRLQDTSLRGTEPDGELLLDGDGRVIRNAALVRLFDYWLALTGEVPDAQIRDLLADHVRLAHGDAAVAAVLALFDRYVAMRAELAALPAAADLEERFARLQATRRRAFGADAAAMFGEEEDYLAHTLARRRLADDPDAQAELDASRPPAQRAAQQEATAALLAAEQTRQLDALGAGAATRRTERTQLWGEAAALRLERLDAERAAWDRRVADYLRDRDLSRFTPAERERVLALEAIGALAPPRG